MEKLLHMFLVDLKIGWGSISRNHQGEVNAIIQVDGDSDLALPAPTGWGVGEGLNRNNGICQDFCLGESCPWSPCLRVHISLVLFELLPHHWSSE